MQIVEKVWRTKHILMEALAEHREGLWFSRVRLTIHNQNNVKDVGVGIRHPHPTKEDAIKFAYQAGDNWLRDNGFLNAP
jgi:hypothetical protein